MTANLTLALVIGGLFTAGTFLLLQRTLTRIVLGIGILGHGANLLLLTAGGRSGQAPVLGSAADGAPLSDPLPQAMALTAIVISFGVTAFLLAMAYRSWQLTRADEVPDDLEDRRIAARRDADDLDADLHAAPEPEPVDPMAAGAGGGTHR